MLIRRLAAVTVLLSAAAAASGLSPVAAAPLPLPPVHHALPQHAAPDRLTVTVSETGESLDARKRTLECHPAGGDHPRAQAACDQLDDNTAWGKETFTPTPRGRACPQIYGGPATAHVEGTWQGRAVDADFDRSNGCEISRWEKFSEVLVTGR